MKRLILFALILFSANITYGQDLIVKSNGDSINCKITSQDTVNIRFTVNKNDMDIQTFIPISMVKTSVPSFYYQRNLDMHHTGYYLQSASRCMWGSAIAGALSTIFTTIGAYNNNTALMVIGGVSAVASLGFSIAIPIQINNAGKAYKRK